MNVKYIIYIAHVLSNFICNSELNCQRLSFIIEDAIDTLFEQINVQYVILLSNSGSEYNELEYIVFKTCINRYPSVCINFRRMIEENAQNFGKIQPFELRKSSILFVSALELSRSSDKGIIQYLKDLRAISIESYSSKFIIFSLSKNEEVDMSNVLKFAWNEYLLDATIVEIIVKSNATRSNLLENVDQEEDVVIGKIHRYNPFLRDYHQEQFDRNVSFFPNKLLDLHGWDLKIGIVHYPPYVYAVELENGEVEYDAVGGKFIETLRNRLNFTIIHKIRTLAQYGVLLPNGSATGLLNDVGTGRLDVVAFSAFLFYSPFSSWVDRTSYTSVEKSCAMVPLIPMNRFLINKNFIYSCLIIIILITLVWIFSFPIRSKKSYYWHPVNIGFLILGVTVPGQPKILRERFLYGCIMVVSLFYSSNVFAQLTSINLDTEQYEVFESFDDLDKSGLIPVLHPNMFNITFGQGDGVLQRLGKKAVQRPDYSEVCTPWLLLGNVSCVVEDARADVLIKMHRNAEGKPRMKLAQPCFWTATRGYILRKSSPFTIRFNQVIMRVIESGIETRWWLDYYSRYLEASNVTEDVGEHNVSEELQQTNYAGNFYFILLGFLASFCVFVVEVMIHHFKLIYVKRKVH